MSSTGPPPRHGRRGKRNARRAAEADQRDAHDRLAVASARSAVQLLLQQKRLLGHSLQLEILARDPAMINEQRTNS